MKGRASNHLEYFNIEGTCNFFGNLNVFRWIEMSPRTNDHCEGLLMWLSESSVRRWLCLIDDLAATLYTFTHAHTPDLHRHHLQSPCLAPSSSRKTPRKSEALCSCFPWTLFLFFSSSFPPSPVLPPSTSTGEFDPGLGWRGRVSKWNIDPLLCGLAFTLSCVLSYRLFRSACNRNYYRRPGRVITWHSREGAEKGPLYISSKEVIYRTCYLHHSATLSLPSDRPPVPQPCLS